MDSEELAFLSAIRRRFWDDAPRLIYADWLDEQGEYDRAEFIRVQCELHRMPLHDPARPELALRERAIRSEHAQEWSAPLLELGAQKVIFMRGIAEGVEISGGALVERTIEFFRRCPTLRIATVSLHNAPLASFLQSGVVAFLTELSLAGNRLGDLALEQLAGSTDLSKLIALNLSYNEFGERGLRTLAERGHLGQLRLLNVTGNGLNSRVVDALPGPRMPKLLRLNLADNQLDATGLWAMLSKLPRTTLKSLNVSDNQIRMPHERVRFPIGLGRLETFELGGNPVGDAMAASLAYSRHVARLVRLDLQRTGVTPVGARALAASPYLGKLEELDLSGNPIPPGDAPDPNTLWLPKWLQRSRPQASRNPFVDLRQRFGSGVRF